MSTPEDISMSKLSLQSSGSQSGEDWDQSTEINPQDLPSSTPRNSVIFPADEAGNGSPGRTPCKGTRGTRSTSELLRIHAEKGTTVKFSQEEATRVADVLGEWINSASGPYEKDDDFFARSHDDIQISSRSPSSLDPNSAGRTRGQSESSINNSSNSRPPSSLGQANS